MEETRIPNAVSRHPTALSRLLALARRAPRRPVCLPELESAPIGFAARIVAEARSRRQPHAQWTMWERLCWIGAGAAVVVCLAAAMHARRATEPSGWEILLSQAEDPIFH